MKNKLLLILVLVYLPFSCRTPNAVVSQNAPSEWTAPSSAPSTGSPRAVSAPAAPDVSARQAPASRSRQEAALLARMHEISSHTLYDYVVELCDDQYAGRV